MSRMPLRIGIVGAGIAGLNAALTLQDAGIASTVYEASERIGGRMHSDTTWDEYLTTEWCGEFVDPDHTTMHKLIQRFNLPTLDLTERIRKGAESVNYMFGRYYSSQELLKDSHSFYKMLKQQWSDIGPSVTYDSYTEIAHQLDQLSVYQWIERYVRGGHQSVLGRYLNMGCTGFYGLDTHIQSSLNLLYMFVPRFLHPHGTVGASTTGRVKIAGGNQRLPETIAQHLPVGSLQREHRLIALKRNTDDTVMLSFDTPQGNVETVHDVVILTLPFTSLRQVDYSQADFDARKVAAIEKLTYGTSAKCFLQFDTRYWYQDGPWPQSHNGFVLTDLDIQVVWDESFGEPSEGGILVCFTGGAIDSVYVPAKPYATSTEDEHVQHYAEHCLRQLEQVFPGISKHYTGKAAFSYPTGDPLLGGGYSCWGVGQYTSIAGYERVRQGPIHFAGEHTSLDAQGFMEGGAHEGERVAREIMKEHRLH